MMRRCSDNQARDLDSQCFQEKSLGGGKLNSIVLEGKGYDVR